MLSKSAPWKKFSLSDAETDKFWCIVFSVQIAWLGLGIGKIREHPFSVPLGPVANLGILTSVYDTEYTLINVV